MRTRSRVLNGSNAIIGSTTLPDQPDAAELPASARWEEISVTPASVARGSRKTAASQDVLVTHELAVVLAQRTPGRGVAGVRGVARARPLPRSAIEARRDRMSGRGTTAQGRGLRLGGRRLPLVLGG